MKEIIDLEGKEYLAKTYKLARHTSSASLTRAQWRQQLSPRR